MIQQRNIMRIIASGSNLVKTTKITASYVSTFKMKLQQVVVDRLWKDTRTSRINIWKFSGQQMAQHSQNAMNWHSTSLKESIKKSSEGDYQRKWNTFLDYVHNKGLKLEDIDKGLVASFLSHLFYVKKLKLSTISHYRSALSSPLLDYF